jgi:uncharacterized protein YfaS (alpha-2-macroglobulin family)
MPVYTEEELAAAPSLAVVSGTPVGEVKRRAEADEVTVTFGVPMVALGAIPDTVDFPLLIEPDVPGTCHWLGTRTVVFRPDTILPPATEFTVRVPKGVTAVDGQMLKQDYGFSFSTVRPGLERSFPYHGQEDIVLDQAIFLRFNMPVDPKRARGSIRLEESNGTGYRFGIRKPRKGEEAGYWLPGDGEDSSSVLVLEPRRRLRIQSRYEVVLERGLLAREGNLGLPEEVRLRFKTFNRFGFRGVATGDEHYPEDALEFRFTNPVPYGNLASDVRFKPEVEIPERYLDYDHAIRRPYLSLPLKPETTYEVFLSKWLKDKFGNRLGRNVRFKLRTVSYRPSANMPTGSGIVESEGRLFHPVWLVNVESLMVRMRRLAQAEVIPFWLNAYERHRYGRKEYGTDDGQPDVPYQRPGFYTHARMWRPGLEPNKRTLLPLKLGPGLEGRKSGFLFCELDPFSVPERGSRFRRAFLQVTPFGLTAKFSPENGLGCVTRLKDASPVPGAEVHLRDDRNRVVWRGRTDETGFVALPGWQELGVESEREWQSPRLWMFARSKEDEAFVHSDWGTGISPWEFGISYDWNPDPTKPEAFVFTEKGLYRAGDTVRLKGLVRAKRRGRWTVAKTRDGRLRIEDSRDETVSDQKVRLSDRGSFSIKVPLADDAVSGYYSIHYELGEERYYGSFRVEAYRPAEFEVDAAPDRQEYVAGDEYKATVSGRYLFGAPMAGEKVGWQVSLKVTHFAPAGPAGYTWGPWMAEDHGRFQAVAIDSGWLDEQGQVRVSAKLDLGKSLWSREVTCEAGVKAKNERLISGRASRVVHRAEFYLGTRTVDEFIQVGDSFGLDVIAATPDGKLLPGQNVGVTVYRRVWKSARKAQTGGRYSWLNERVDEKAGGFKLKTGEKPVRRWYKPERPGYYWVKCEARDRRRNPVRTDARFWVGGKGEAAWEMRDDDVIELVCDRTSYRPGDTARILVKSPWTNVTALVAVEREFVLDHFTVPLAGNAEFIRVPIAEDYLPNVFVSVALLKGRTADNQFGEEGEDLGRPGFKIGYVELPVDPDARRLEVKVEPGQEEYEPGEKASIALEVAGRDGPTRAEVTLAVVDLGVLQLTGYATPDPFGLFYAHRPLSVKTAESRLHVIGQRNYGEKGEAAAGDGELRGASVSGMEQYDFAYREKFLETALWLPSVQTDGSGRARVEFELPGNLTTWQVVAVAATEQQFGSGEAKFKTNKPLLVQPSLPRFVRPGDRFRAGVMVHNRTGAEMNVALKAEAGGAATLDPGARQQVSVQPNQAQEVVFEYACFGGEQAEFRFTASAGGSRDALKWSLPVKNPVVTEAVAVYEQTSDSLAKQWVEAPADVFSGVGGLEVTVASSGLAGLERGIEYLRTYPYECLEQRLSRILPFIVGEALINTFNLSELKGEALREFVRAELARVAQHQDERGGFHFWAGEFGLSRPSPFLSAYCLHTLARARDAGYAVDDMVVERGKSFLANWLGYAGRSRGWPYTVDEELTTRALAVYALALWGSRQESYASTLLERVDRMSVFGKAYLLKAMHLLGSGPEQEAGVVQAMNNKLKLAPTTAHYEEESEGGWIWHSNVRTTASVLQALVETRGEVEFAEKAVRWLVQERKSGRWRTTQENVYVFEALATYYRTFEKVEPDFVAMVRLAGEEILREAFRGRSLESRRVFVSIDSLGYGTKQELKIGKQGAGRFYYGLRLTYAPKGELEPKDEGIGVEKTIRPVKGRGSGYRRGEQYLVTLKVQTGQDRLFVVLDDPLPAGFEIVNTSFETEGRQSREALSEARESDQGQSWWGGFDHEELYDDRYVLFATALERGVHTRTYLVKALTPGRFFMPATRVEEMYAPEVFGRTGQRWVEVE